MGNYYENLLELRKNLLAIERYPHNLFLYYQTNSILFILTKNIHYIQDSDFHGVIAYVQKFVNKRLNLIEIVGLGLSAIIALTASTGYFFWRQPAISTNEILGSSIIIGMFTLFTKRYVTSPLIHQFILKENKNRKDLPLLSPIIIEDEHFSEGQQSSFLQYNFSKPFKRV